jgi:hypothetical protein
MKKEIIFLFLIIMIAFVSSSKPPYCVDAQIASINPSSVGQDEDFAVSISVENCGEKVPEYISLEIIKKSKDIVVKDPLVDNLGERWYVNSRRLVNFNLRTSADAAPGVHAIETKLVYGARNFLIE